MTQRNDKKGFDFDPIDLTGLLPPKASNGLDQKESTRVLPGMHRGPQAPLGDYERIDQIIDSLFQKMRKKGDFPSFSKQILEVNKILKLKYSSAKDIADVIMKDFSLSNKLLKLVNSSFYGQFSKNGISSVSSAMIILGADQIQQAAASLMLFEHMQANAQNQDLKEIAVSTFMSGLMAKDLAGLALIQETEEFQVCAMFHNLGENLIAFYFPEKYQRVQDFEKRHDMSREEASRKILSITFRDLGIGVAKKWGIPGNIIKSMACDPISQAPLPGRKLSRDDYLGLISSFSNSLCRIFQGPDQRARGEAVTRLLEQFKGVIDLKTEDIEALLNRVSEKIKVHANQLNINIGKIRLIKNMGKDNGDGETVRVAARGDKKNQVEIRKRIHEDIRRIDTLLTKDFVISDILNDILNVMSREFDFDRIAICIKDVANNTMAVRHGLGKDIDAFRRDFHFPIDKTQDIFHLSLVRERDYSVPDINDPKYKALVPSWFRMLHMASGFDLYVIVIDHVAIGFFYADRETASEFSSFEEQKNMKRLRNLAEKAIRIKKNLN
ncbi:MAG: HDOD domain-containing protein [Proteobacteria bacterium]|nr:HDOD domain-containing protein [Pseudomonadota bacterium]